MRAPETFQKQTLWPEFLALSKELEATLDELTDRVIREAIHEDVTDAPDEKTAKALPPRGTAAGNQDASEGSKADGANDGSPT